MNKINILKSNMILIFLILLSSQFVFSQKKNVLVIHSYHQGLEWTDDISDGIESVFSECKDSIIICYEYLDAKKYADSIEYYSRVADIYAKKYRNKISVILISDNASLDFMSKFSYKFATDVPVVFCGINDFNENLIKNISKITGVVENVDYYGNIEIIQRFHPEIDTVIVINDNKTLTSIIHKKLFSEAIKSFKNLKFIFWENMSIEEIEHKSEILTKNNVIFLINYHIDKDSVYIDYQELAEKTSKSGRVPVYAPFTFFYGKGIVGGLLTSGKIQGETAAKMAKEILSGKSINEIPVIKDSPNQYMFDYAKLKHFKINRDFIPQNSLFINYSEDEEALFFQRKDYALLFGCDLYDDINWKNLKNPVKDAITIAGELKNRYGFNIEVIENPTLDTMSSAIKRYCRKQYNSEDQLLIFFSGHGYFDEDEKEGYIVVKNSIYGENSNSSYYNYSKLLSQIDKIECKHIFLVIDVCFSGTLFKEVALNKSDGISEVEVSETKDIGLIKEVLKYKTRKALTAGGKDEVSDGIIHSNFAYKFIEALRTGGGEKNILTTSQIKKVCETLKPSPILQDFAPSEPGNDFLFIAK